jgi:hypothetical protein
MTGDLTGQRVLLIAPRFFGYDEDIAAEIRRRGASVDLIRDRPFDSPFMRVVTRYGRRMVMPAADRYYLRELERLGGAEYRAVLVINGQTLSKRVLKVIRSSFPTARMILYLWDSFRNRRSVFETLDSFDDRFSFEPEAARHGEIAVRPMFFCRPVDQPLAREFEYMISFVGTAHTDRYAVVKALSKTLPAGAKCCWYFYLHATWVYWAYRVGKPSFWTAKKSEFRFTPLSRGEVDDLVLKSRILLEIEHPRQSGLTIRAFDAIGSSRKLVTTNGEIRSYDFYREENICVIDRGNPRIPESFIAEPYRELPPHIYQKYSLAGWMNDVLAGISNLRQPIK